jgi:hypothetical protein
MLPIIRNRDTIGVMFPECGSLPVRVHKRTSGGGEEARQRRERPFARQRSPARMLHEMAPKALKLPEP